MAAPVGIAEVLAPTVANVGDGETVYLGEIGPGQTIDIVVNGAPAIGGRGNIGGRWQNLLVLEVPAGWTGFGSADLKKEMAVSMPAAVKASPTARDGTYRIKLQLVEDTTKQQELGSVIFYATIVINRKVMATSVTPPSIETGLGQPARYTVVIENHGSASDTFEISSKGMPDWDFTKKMHVPPGGRVVSTYEFISNEEKEYSPTIIVKSLSSDEMLDEHALRMVAKSNVISDIRATKNGVLLFPTILEPLYSLLGIIGHII